MHPAFRSAPVVGVGVAVTDLAAAAAAILAWSGERRARYVCAANVHMVMEARDSAAYRAVVQGADLVVPDGAPLVWALRAMGHRSAGRVFGPDLMEALLAGAAAAGVPVGLYGGSEAVSAAVAAAATARWPGLAIALRRSPPFRPLTAAEEAAETAAVAASGARLLLVGLGCPRQEAWMAARAGQLDCVMVGVGQAFDLMAGRRRRPPAWMHRAGLGWLHRLAHDPRRLWRRYLLHNPRFVALLAGQWLARALAPRGAGAPPGGQAP